MLTVMVMFDLKHHICVDNVAGMLVVFLTSSFFLGTHIGVFTCILQDAC